MEEARTCTENITRRENQHKVPKREETRKTTEEVQSLIKELQNFKFHLTIHITEREYKISKKSSYFVTKTTHCVAYSTRTTDQQWDENKRSLWRKYASGRKVTKQENAEKVLGGEKQERPPKKCEVATFKFLQLTINRTKKNAKLIRNYSLPQNNKNITSTTSLRQQTV